MKFNKPLIEGRLIKRYKRFLADIELQDGTVITAHTPNTGSMKGCSTPGARVWVYDTGNPKRKYPHAWELIEVEAGIIVGINTGLPNMLVKEGIENATVSELQGYNTIRSEVRYGKENSRIDLLLENYGENLCYVEVKNVTLVEDEIAYFPDAISKRGAKHLRELAEMVRQGHRGVIFFCIQRKDALEFRPADDIDLVYGETLRQVLSQGVEALAYQADVLTREINLSKPVPISCP